MDMRLVLGYCKSGDYILWSSNAILKEKMGNKDDVLVFFASKVDTEGRRIVGYGLVKLMF